MNIQGTEVITSQGLHISMPIPGVVRITDGNHKISFAVTAKGRRKKPVLEGKRIRWGNISLLPQEGMALYLGDTCLCVDYTGPMAHPQAMSREALEALAAEGHIGQADVERLSTRWKIEVVKALGPEDAIYGLGDKTGFLNKRHYAYENWNTDDPSPHCDNFRSLYKSIPFFILSGPQGCCGILVDNTFRTRFDFGKESDSYLYWSHTQGSLDYYMLPGKDLKAVLAAYYRLTGENQLQQKWVYGFHQSRWSYESAEEVLSVAQAFRDNRLPLDAIHMDIDYMQGYRVFTFDGNRFPDPAGLNKTLASQGVRTVAIVDPGVKVDDAYFVYREGLEQGHFAKNPDGSVYEGAVWPGPSVFPDFTQEKTRRWWGDKLQILLDAGVSGIWNDMNEPANFTGPLPDDVQFSQGGHLKIHNVYGHLMAQATHEGLERLTGDRPFVLTRACYAGSQRYCSGWTGDNHSLWAHMQLSITQMLNLGLSGMNSVGSDVGGFGSDTTPELLVRWMQLGAVSPFFRNHSANQTRRQEPYAFDKKTLRACRSALDLRYHLLPYLYDLAHGQLPMMRPMVMEFPGDPLCRDVSDQFMLGSQLLAAPVLTPGAAARAVYLPKGTWYDYYTGERYRGGRYIVADAPLDKLPLFARAGAIVPVAQGTPQCTDEISGISLEVFPGTGRFIHYTDDGRSLAYRQGEIHRLSVAVRGREVIQTVLEQGYPGPDRLPIVIRA